MAPAAALRAVQMRWLYGRFGRESATYFCSHFHPLPLLTKPPKSFPWMANDDPLGNTASHSRTGHTCCTSHTGHTVAMRTGICGLYRQSIGTSAPMPIGPPFPIQRLLESRWFPFHTQGSHYPMPATQCKALAVASNRRSTATEQTLFRLLPPTLPADAANFSFSTAFSPFVAQPCHNLKPPPHPAGAEKYSLHFICSGRCKYKPAPYGNC